MNTFNVLTKDRSEYILERLPGMKLASHIIKSKRHELYYVTAHVEATMYLESIMSPEITCTMLPICF